MDALRNALVRRSLPLSLLLLVIWPGAALAGDEAPASEMPLVFFENCGQSESGALFLARGPGMDAAFFTDRVELWLEGSRSSDQAAALRLGWRPLGVSRAAHPRAAKPTGARLNWYRGGERFEAVPAWAEIRYDDLYPCIDWSISAQGHGLKSEWIVRPGADIADIRLRFEGAQRVELVEGELWISTELGLLIEAAPVLYQEGPDGRRPIAGGYRLGEDGTVGFWAGDHDATQELVIDPDLEWSTFLGGSHTDSGGDIEIDASGNWVVAGQTTSSDFPVTPGAYDTDFGMPLGACFVAKLSPSGQLLFATFLSGSLFDYVTDLRLLPGDDIVVIGGANSPDFPVTPGAFDTTWGGGVDAFVSRFDSSLGTLIFSGLLGGTRNDLVEACAVDASGNLYCVGSTESPDFPVTSGAYDTILDPTAADGFITKIDPTGSSVLWSTFLGTDDAFDQVQAVVSDSSGRLTVAGRIDGPGFPVTPGAFDTSWIEGKGYVARLDVTGSVLDYSTYLGGSRVPGSPTIAMAGLALDEMDRPYVVGTTHSPGFPTTAESFDPTYNGNGDGFLTLLDATLSSLVASTVLGGVALDEISDLDRDPTTGALVISATTDSLAFSGVGRHGAYAILSPDLGSVLDIEPIGGTRSEVLHGLALGANGQLGLTGFTQSPDFPVTPGAFDTGLTGDSDAFVTVARIRPFLLFHGPASPGQNVQYSLHHAPVAEAGNTLLVFLSCTGAGQTLLPGGEILPLTFDGCTALGLQLAASLQGTVDATGQAVTPMIPFPPVPAGLLVFSAGTTWNLSSAPKVSSVTRPIRFVTR